MPREHACLLQQRAWTSSTSQSLTAEAQSSEAGEQQLWEQASCHAAESACHLRAALSRVGAEEISHLQDRILPDGVLRHRLGGNGNVKSDAGREGAAQQRQVGVPPAAPQVRTGSYLLSVRRRDC